MSLLERRIEVNGEALTGQQAAELRALLKRRIRRALNDGDEVKALAAILRACVSEHATEAEKDLLARCARAQEVGA